MKNQRHKRKEVYSVLLVSNMDRQSRQFQISLFTIRLIISLVVLLCVITGTLIYFTSVSARKQADLQEQTASLTKLNEQLTAENDSLNQDKLSLTAEKEALEQQIASAEAEADTEEEQEEEEPESHVPSRYPSDGAGVLKSTYSEEQPFVSFSTYSGGNVVAAGDGTVTVVGSDDTYRHIIEVEHEDGYRTRYLCHADAELKTEEGAQVQAGDILLTITANDTQLDYQVLLNDETIDPLSVIEAKG